MSASVHFDLDSNGNNAGLEEDPAQRMARNKRAMLKRSFSLVPERLESKSKSNLYNDRVLKVCEVVLEIISIFLVVLLLPFSLIMSLKVVAQYQRAVVFRLGRLITRGTLGPGLVFILPCLDIMKRIDLRTLTFDVPTQEVLTRDSVTVAVDAVVYYRIFDPVMSVVNVEDANRSTRLLAQTTLRNVLGTVDLTALLTDREEIAASMQETLDTATDAWGMKVERVEIKDVRLPLQLQRAMAAEAEAAREAGAKVIAADGEHRASHSLRLAAEELSLCPVALQLRYLQTLNSISAEKNSTIIFPLPVDVLSAFKTNHQQHHPFKNPSHSPPQPPNLPQRHYNKSGNYNTNINPKFAQYSSASSNNASPSSNFANAPSVRVQMSQRTGSLLKPNNTNTTTTTTTSTNTNTNNSKLFLENFPISDTTSPSLSSISNGLNSTILNPVSNSQNQQLDYNSSECTV